jgi:hypothetical protein
MGVFIKRIFFGFIIGLTMGSAYASSANRKPVNRKPANNTFREAKPLTSTEAVSGDEIFAETETFQVRADRVAHVLSAMTKLGLAEDIDFAWMNKVPKAKAVSFVCYSIDCYSWAKRRLRTISVAPVRPEEALGYNWHDAQLDSIKDRQLTEDEKIKARHTLPYSSGKKEG